MNRRSLLSKRRLLAGVASVFVGGSLAGCSEQSNGSEATEGTETEPAEGTETEPAEGTETEPAEGTETGATEGTETEPAERTETGATEEEPSTSPDSTLDLREANVVGVAVEGEAGQYTFDVTLHHDDAGEDGYANWWQVERLEGTRLGRRELRHAHTQQPFTRSATIEIPPDVRCVVVRGHDQTHGYGGQSMIVNLETAETRAIAQGADPLGATERDCP
ncbi:hypothetical protein DVK02_09650 [Halobellus sp. Atlit-31R]|nr:hypothetical protein DVK02_09650 [Halobellus sp. Atlit-31R]